MNKSGLTLPGNWLDFVPAKQHTEDIAATKQAIEAEFSNVDNTRDLDKPVSTATQTALNTKADLVGGKIPLSQVPASVLVDVFEVASQSAMLALAAGAGDVAIRTDQGRKTYILSGNDPTILDRWKPFVFSTIVSSVDGQAGDIDLTGTYAKNYDPDHTYPQYAVCFYLGIQYFSRVTGNKCHQPDISPTQWKVSSGGVGVSVSLGYTFDNGTLDTTIDGFVPYMNTTPAATPEVSPAGTIPTGFGIAWNGTNTIIGKGDLILTKPALSCYGAGFYHDFHIDRGCLGTITKLLFRFMTSANYVDGYLQMFILDKTNSNFIPITNSLPATYASISDWLTTFIPSTATEYRLYIHCATSTMTTWTAEFGGFELGRRDLSIGAAIGATKTIVPTIHGITTDPTLGTIALNSLTYRRSGESLEGIFTFVQASGGSVGSGKYYIDIPEGVSADVSGINVGTDPASISKIGSGSAYTTGSVIPALVCLISSNRIGIILQLSATNESLWGNDSFGLSGPIYVTVSFRIPKIAQWTSNVNLASDFKLYGFNTQATVNTNDTSSFGSGISGTPILAHTSATYLDVKMDNPQAGDDFVVEIRSKIDGAWLSPEKVWIASLNCPINNVHLSSSGTYEERNGIYIARISSGIFRIFFSSRLIASTLTGGVIATAISWSQVVSASDGFDRWRVRKVSNGNPSEIPSLVRAEFNSMASYALVANVETLLSFTTKVEDTQTAYSSGTFVVPMDGVYDLEASFGEAAGATAINFQVYTKVNDVKKYTLFRLTQGSYVTHTLRESVRVKKGDTIKLTYLVSSAMNLNSDPATTYYKIVWIGK